MIEIPLQQPYAPEYVEGKLKEAGFFRALWRILQVASVLLLGLAFRKIDSWRWTYRRGETREDRQRRRATWLLNRIIKLGPAFVKVGQSVATRPDLLPLVYIQVFATIHDQLPPFSNDVAKACFEEELGWKPETLFEWFDPEPFAAASLGQVYHAVTHQGHEVAVKIQRPDLMEVISLDLALVRRLAVLAERYPRLTRRQPWVSLVDEFGAKLFEELDYIHEAHLTERFGINVSEMQGVYAPKVYWEYSSRRVLTTEYIQGIRVTDKEKLEAAGVDFRNLLSQGVRANLKQLFEHGLFHADPHPGNLLVRPEDGTLVFLDFGMMGIVQPEQKLRILEIFVDVINQRPENLKDNLIALGCLRADARWDEIVPIANDMFKALFGDMGQRHTFQEVTGNFAPLIYEYEFRIPVDFAYIVRAIMTLEGISLQLDPDFDIWAVTAPYAARMMLTFPDPSLRRRLMDELLTEGGALDWDRLQQLTLLASHDTAFHLDTEGLVEPALNMLLSSEGAALRRALVAELLQAPGSSAGRVEVLAPLLTADRSLSGREILDRLIAFLLSDDGEETRGQLAEGLRTGNNGNRQTDWTRLRQLASLARQLHPDFSMGTLVRALGGYLLSEEGRPVRNQALAAGAQWVADGLAGALFRLTRPAVPTRPQIMPDPE